MTGETVVCAGHVNWDVTLSVDRLPPPDGEAAIADQTSSGGGSASNTAVGLAELGHRPVLLGSVGDDDYGPLVRNELTDFGVDCTYLETVPDGVTTVKYLVVDEAGQVMVFANDGANEAFDAETLPGSVLAGAAHLHLTSQRPETATRLAQRAKDCGIPVSFDPGRRLDGREYEAVYRLAEMVFLNEHEAETAQAQGVLDECSGVTVVKRGAHGAHASRDGERVSHPGYPADVVDTAGAGDAFAAGFIAARLDGEPLDSALAVGNACGALATQSKGTHTTLSWADVRALCDR